MVMKVFFVDDRLGEILSLWGRSGCANDHELLPLEPFVSIERTRELVEILQPDVVLVGHGLSVPGVTGSDVVRALSTSGYLGTIIANSGGGIEPFERDGVHINLNINRNPQNLQEILGQLSRKENV